MDHEAVDYHLKQATSHLNIAYLKTQELMEDDAAKNEVTRMWDEFLQYLFGDEHAKENHADGRTND